MQVWWWWVVAAAAAAAAGLAWCRRNNKGLAKVKVHVISKKIPKLIHVVAHECGPVFPRVAVSHVTLQRAPSDPPGSDENNHGSRAPHRQPTHSQIDFRNAQANTSDANASGNQSDQFSSRIDQSSSQSNELRLNPIVPIHALALPKLPLPEQLIHKRTYFASLPRPIIQLPADHETEEVRQKKFSVTRSPSLEKDEKSPYEPVGTKFGFEFGASVKEKKDLDIEKGIGSEMSEKEMSPKELNVTNTKEMSPGNLRRFQSVSTKLNMCSVNETPLMEGQQERLEMQNSPRILECSSAKEKSNVSKFDFSPRLLSESSPKFFTPPEMISPMFFVDHSPKSVYYDSVRSPKFFPETPRVDEQPQSPRALADHLNRNHSLDKPNSPRILTPKPKSPKVYSANKENYFTFDNVHLMEDGSSRVSTKPRRYLGRNSIERERFTPPADKETKKYRRHNSCEANYKNLETILPKTDKTLESPIEDKDMVDCCAKLDSITFESESKIDQDLLSAQMRRQRLKSISLDSENAKKIELHLGLPIAKQLKEHINEAYKQDLSTSCESIERCKVETDIEYLDSQITVTTTDESLSVNLQKKTLRQATDAKSFIEMPRFSPKEFEITVTSEEGAISCADIQTKKSKNLRNLTIDLTKRDTELEKEILEFEKLYTDAEEKKVKTPTLKVKATSLDSSESANLSLPQKKTLEVPQNSVSVPNTPKKQLKRILAQRGSKEGNKFGYNADHRRLCIKGQDSGIFLRENHASLMLYQPSTSRMGSRTMGSFDENIADLAGNAPEINILQVGQESNQALGGNLLNYKNNLSVSSTNLKTLPEGVTSDDFEPSAEDDKLVKKLHRRNSNQMLTLDGKYSTHSLQSSNCSLNSSGASTHNLASVRTSLSNFSLNTDNRQKKLFLERRDSNATMQVTSELIPTTRLCSASTSASGDSKNCLLQRRGSNNSLTLNITPALSRHSSNSSLNKDTKIQKKGLLERRSSNTSLTLNINNSNPQLSVSRALSISNYNLEGSSMNLASTSSTHISDTPAEPKKGILERRSSNTSLTLNIQPQEPRVIEIDESMLEPNLKEVPKHRKSLSTENLLPKSYKTTRPSKENKSFGSHDNLWSNSYTEQDYPQNLTYVCGDHDDEIIYAFGHREDVPHPGFVRNITTKPLSPQTTSEDFRLYLANMQHLQNASSVLSRHKLRDLNDVFQNGYSNFVCASNSEGSHCCLDSNVDSEEKREGRPCSEYQKLLLRNLHQEFWDMPTNFQEKPIVSGSNPKNRYKTILPNEHSRFLLDASEGATNEAYINANYIKGHEYTRNSYIATQGPLQNTIYDFWTMIQQNQTSHLQPTCPNRIQKIVMLTNFVENNRQKCDKYFPVEVNEQLTFSCPVDEEQGNFLESAPSEKKTVFVIKNCGIVNKPGYTIRKLSVKFIKHDKKTCVSADSVKMSNSDRRQSKVTSDDGAVLSRTFSHETNLFASNFSQFGTDQNTEAVVTESTVYHYWFHNWADHKCPKDVSALLNLSLDILTESVYDFSENPQSATEKCSCSVSPKIESKFIFPPKSSSLDSTNNQCESTDKTDNPGMIVNPLDFCLEAEWPPAVVHCSAGIGRTGCFIAILNGIKQLLVEQKVDVLGIVCNMRLNRGGMVQNSEQYELIHKVLCLFESVCLPQSS